MSIVPGAALTRARRDAILSLCARAYAEDVRAYYDALEEPMHVLATIDGTLVSHAMWVTRWLAAGTRAPMRTAYVELVATEPARQRRGYASAVMRHLMAAIQDYELAALGPSDAGTSLYEQLGWQRWRGPLFIRHGDALVATPDELVMIHPVSATSAMDLDDALSAEWREGELW